MERYDLDRIDPPKKTNPMNGHRTAVPKTGTPPASGATPDFPEATDQGKGWRRDSPKTSGDHAVPAVKGHCPHCQERYIQWTARWVALKIRKLRVYHATQRVHLQCRRCRRWFECPARIKRDGPQRQPPPAGSSLSGYATGPPTGR